MTGLHRYLAEEIATDHVDGLLSRREAIRRLGLLGLGAAAATELISACAKPPEPADAFTPTALPESPAGSAPPPPGSALPTTPITWAGPEGRLQGAYAQAAASRGCVLVIHENKGLTDWERSVAGRLAGAGYSALAIDLLSEEGGTGTFHDPAAATAALAAIPPERFTHDLNSAVAEMRLRGPGQRAGVLGFCFGGGLVWRLLTSGALGVSAAVPFYGPLPPSPDFVGSTRSRRRAGHLRGPGLPGHGLAARRQSGAGPRRTNQRAGRGTRRRPRLLQRHRGAIQRRRGGRRMAAGAGVVRPLPGGAVSGARRKAVSGG